jgi:asparagine synthase (glutamine-hydrolysing)
MGFSGPLTQWMAGPLRNWAGDLLLSGENDGILRGKVVRREWDRFNAGDSTNSAGLWALVMFKAWQRRWLTTVPKYSSHYPEPIIGR